MKNFFITLLCIASINIAITNTSNAQLGDTQNDIKSSSSIITSADSIAPGETFKVALKLTHPKEWHSYYHNDGIGVSGIPSVEWILPSGFTASKLKFPTPHMMLSYGLNSYGYDGTNYFITEITAPKTLNIGEKLSITANAAWQICKVSCIQEEAKHKLQIIAAEKTQPNPYYLEEISTYQKKYIPTPKIPSDWKITASSRDDTINITINSNDKFPNDLQLFEYNGQIDAQKPIKINPDGAKLTITGLVNNGNEFKEEPAPKLSSINAILHSPSTPLVGDKHSIFITTDWNNNTPHTSSSDNTSDKQQTTTTQKAISLDGSTERKFTLLTVIPFAFLAGLILNIMPCVFPVLGLKITGFAQQAGEDESKIKWHGIVFGLGILVSMWALAGTLIVLKSFGEDIGWGYQLQNPIALAIILIIMFVMGLNLSGLFEMGTKLTGVGNELQSKKGFSGSFFSGLLTTLIATPCSAPIVAPVMGYATNLNTFPSLFVFTIFALGIASPYVILAFMPKLIQKLPKPGAWMVTFKKIMAYPMFAAVIFFFGAFMSLTGKTGAIWLLWAFLAIAFALYIYGHWGVPYKPKSTRIKSFIATLTFAGIAYWAISKAVNAQPQNSTTGREITKDGFVWEVWSPEKVAKLRSSGKRVYVDFTADN